MVWVTSASHVSPWDATKRSQTTQRPFSPLDGYRPKEAIGPKGVKSGAVPSHAYLAQSCVDRIHSSQARASRRVSIAATPTAPFRTTREAAWHTSRHTFTVEQLRPRRASRGPNWCIRTGLAFRESATCSGLATPPMLHERRRWCGQSCGEVHGMGSQQRCADQGVRCVVRVGQSPRAACSSASTKSAAAVALQLL